MIAVFPTEILYVFNSNLVLVRLNRLAKVYRVRQFVDLTQIRTGFPSVFRTLKLAVYCYLIFHWNGCLYFHYSVYYNIKDGTPLDWKFSYGKIMNPLLVECKSRIHNKARCIFIRSLIIVRQFFRTKVIEFGKFTRKYLQSFYWSALTLITLGEQPPPSATFQNQFEIMDTVIGLVIFAVIISDISNMVNDLNASKSEFEFELDGCKLFMYNRKVLHVLQKRVIDWFGYMKNEGILRNDEEVSNFLPRRLFVELISSIHIQTLLQSDLFQIDFLQKIILKLQLRIYSPMDYVCEKGDVGKEMFIIKEGQVQVVSDDGTKVFATLSKGSVFGGLSILNIPGNKNGNKRTASIRSVGYTDVYVLTKDDLWEILQDYPALKNKLLERGRKVLEKDNLLENTDEEPELHEYATLDEKLEFITAQLNNYDVKLKNLYDDFSVCFAVLNS
ncbi:unnamed protein product [Enterobius vermicularis]|uniref:Cyclic nucleotide-binding domain-containing protein n=1 Tax=Enterobius vermicularis TaxID=51028 RepID=A0A3P6ITX4_ENTVE|nr:unnamed protein product [Enterobius vermicularis]